MMLWRRFHITIISLLALVWLLPGRLWGQEVPKVLSFAPVQYGAMNQNWALTQAPDRRMYIANTEGLLRYDGVAWETYPLPRRQIVRSVAAGPDGRIYCGGFGEFGYWAYDTLGRFGYRSLSQTLDYPLAHSEEIWHIVPQAGRVWFQSFSTLYAWDDDSVQAVLPPYPASIMFAFPVGERLLLQAKGVGILELYPNQTFALLPGSEALAGMEVMSILPAPGASLLVCTANHGIFHYAGGALRPWGQVPDLVRYQLNKALLLPDGGYAIGTILDGLYVLDAQGRLRFHLNQENGLQNNTVLSMTLDQDGQLWVGLDKGIDMVALNSPLLYYPDREGYMGSVYAACFYQGELYLGTNHGLYMRSAGDVAFRLVEGTQGQVWSLRVLGEELLCGHNAGVFVLRQGLPRWIDGPTGTWEICPWPGQPEVVLLGTYTGLLTLHRTGGDWTLLRKLDAYRGPARQVAFDRTGTVWIAHPYQGLYRLHPGRLGRDSLERLGSELPTDYGLSLLEMGGRVYVHADTAYYRWDEGRSQLVQVDTVQGQALPPGRGRLLPGRAGALFWAGKDELRYLADGQTYAVSLSLVPGYETVLALDSNRYLCCLDEGYALFAPQAASQAAAWQVQPIITQVDGLEASPVPLLAYPATARVERLALRPAQRNLRFRFSVPQYTQPVRFRHRLLGFAPRWSAWEREPFKDFTNLPPGHYTFEVQSSLGYQTARLSLVLAAPWYRTGWAYGGYTALVLAALWLLAAYQRHRLERRRRRLEIEHARELHRQRLDARNEQLRLDIENKNRALDISTMNLVRKNEILLQLKTQLLHLRRAWTGAFPDAAHREIVHLIDQHLESDHDWDTFETHFSHVHERFFKQLKRDYPDLTPGDLRLAAYLRMNLASKEIAPLLNISLRGVENKRYRLRKKLDLATDENLIEVLMRY
ncbi:MAG: transcriptional regulator [Bacteroidia bacterium]